MAKRHLLLAGSFGPERVPARPHPEDADWYLPLHLRDEHGARERIAAQATLGADVIVAPTWLTHRRALLPLGETRRAGAWTAAAVRTARQATELGLERREERLAETPEDDPGHGRPAPLVAASLPALDEEPEVDSGRLLPREAATARDYRDQAGIIADARPDLILVEGQRTEADARSAIGEAVETGLPVWAALMPSALATTDTEGWLQWAGAAAVTRLLFPPPPADRVSAADGALHWGAFAGTPASVPEWLDLGADTIARLDGATVPELEGLREAIDAYEQASLEAERLAGRRRSTALTEAAAIAPGGAAVWVGPLPSTPLPDGFDWLVVGEDAAPRLPQDRFRLAVASSVEATRALVRTLERGGVLLGPAIGGTGLRTLTIDGSADPPLATYRRET